MCSQENKQRLISLGENVTDEWIQTQLNECVSKIAKNMQRFGTQFPSACATNGRYRLKANDDWTNGFWTGMLWLAYEWSHQEKFRLLAMENIDSFQQRLEEHFVLDHHDIGFLYSLSAGAGYKITGDERCKQEVLAAAEVLSARFQENSS